MPTDAQIHADIEDLRARTSDTQELYREVCVILFFRYGITPTANKLYQYVRKGSMSAPAEALSKFWAHLREKSRVRIEHPDLPDPLKSAAGELVATLWGLAQKAAQENLAAFQFETQKAVMEAQTTLATAESARAAAVLERNHARQTAEVAEGRALQLERDLAAERASKAVLTAQLEAADRQQTVLEAALAEARHEFAAELEKLRQALQRSEDRCDASEKRALMEIDRERTVANKLQKDLSQARQIQQEVEEKHRVERMALQAELGNARQQLGVAEGTQQEMRTANQRQAEQLQSLSVTLSEREIQRTLLERELVACQDKSTVLTAELQRLRKKPSINSAGTKPQKSRKAAIG